MAIERKATGSRFLAFAPSPILLIGLICFFLGQRSLAHLALGSKILSILGIALVVISALIRLLAFAKNKDSRRSLEGIFSLCHVGVLLALLGYWVTTTSGLTALGLEGASAEKFATAITVLWIILLVISIVPLLVVESTIGISGRHSYRLDSGGETTVEIFRVREAALSGLSIALAASFLMVTCNVADQRNIRKDVSYFKTSSPGTSTENIVKSLDKPLTVNLFFPPTNEVAEEVETYFEALEQATGKVEISKYNRLTDIEIAKKNQAMKDGTVVLSLGDNKERFTLNPDIKNARRTQLRELDKKVQEALMKVVRSKRVAYLTVGHGELNQSGADRENVLGDARSQATKSTHLRKWLRSSNYEVKEYKGLGAPIPEDADILISLAPQVALTLEEQKAIDAYLAKGGAALLVFDPTGEGDLGILEKRLGVRYDARPLADDKEFVPIQRGAAAHQYLATNQFSSHASISSASRLGSNFGIAFFRTGSLVDAQTDGPATKKTYVIKSLASSWRDTDGNWTFDGSSEKRKRYNIVAAVENPVAEGAEETPANKMRVVIASDAELFSDMVMRPSMRLGTQTPPQAIVLDIIKWLGGEEAFSGTVNNEKDVFIQHTKSEDVVWFYLTILGVPFLVLVLGLGYVFGRRRSKRRA